MGAHLVTFARPIAGCLLSSTLGSNDVAAQPGSTGVVSIPRDSSNQVVVATFDSVGKYQDRDFYVQMVCP